MKKKKDDHIAERVRAKLGGFTVDGYIVWDASEDSFFLTFGKPVRTEVARCPRCKHSHGTSWNMVEDGLPLDNKLVRQMGLEKGQYFMRVCLSPIDDQQEED